METQSNFERELTTLINKYSVESQSDTPDFILATFVLSCLQAFNKTVKARDTWFRFEPWGKINRTSDLNDIDLNTKGL